MQAILLIILRRRWLMMMIMILSNEDYCGVLMAQNCIRVPLSSNKEARAREVAKLKEEGNIGDKLASHRHIITLADTYWKEYNHVTGLRT